MVGAVRPLRLGAAQLGKARRGRAGRCKARGFMTNREFNERLLKLEKQQRELTDMMLTISMSLVALGSVVEQAAKRDKPPTDITGKVSLN